MQHLIMTGTEFQTIPEDQRCGLPTTQELLTRRILQAREQEQAIGRQPTEEDFKEVSIANNPNYPTQELIAYKGKPLGRILFAWEAGWDCSRLVFTFEPNPTFKQDGTI